MNEVLSEMTWGMEKESRNILFRYATSIKLLKKDELFDFLLKESVRNCLDKLFYNSGLKAFYSDVYDFIIDNLAGVNSIQIYNDNAIYLWEGNRQKAKLIVFEDDDFCNDELTSTMIQELISFAENN